MKRRGGEERWGELLQGRAGMDRKKEGWTEVERVPPNVTPQGQRLLDDAKE